jgi:hypothetical protein
VEEGSGEEDVVEEWWWLRQVEQFTELAKTTTFATMTGRCHVKSTEAPQLALELVKV